MKGKMKNIHRNQSKGKSAEILFELMCTRLGWGCCKPIADFMQYDYLIEREDGVFEKVQVKTSFYDKNKKCIRCDLRRSKAKSNNKTRYETGDFDIVAIPIEVSKWIIIPWDKIKGKSEINLSDKRIYNGVATIVQFDIEDI